MAHKSRAVIICVALILLSAAMLHQLTNNQHSHTERPGSRRGNKPLSGRRGRQSVFNPKAPAIEIDHGDIDGLMPAMQMEFPVTDPKPLNGIAVNDHIDFTIEAAKGQMKVTAIKKK